MNIGKVGEAAAKTYLSGQGWEVKDLTACSSFYPKDIDFLISRGRERYYIEVKWDTRIHQTGNMFIETTTNLDTNKEGWFEFCQAEFIFYGDARQQLFYVFRLEDLKDYIRKDFSHLESRKAADYNWRGQVKKISQGLIVPIEDFRKQYPVEVITLPDAIVRAAKASI